MISAKKTFVITTVILTIFAAVSCEHGRFGQLLTPAKDSINWQDSATQLLMKIEQLQKVHERDSQVMTTEGEQLELSEREQLDELQEQNDRLMHRSRFTTGGVAMILGIVALLAFLAVNGRWTRRLGIKNQQLERERNLVVAKNRQLAVERDRAEAASKAKTAFIRNMTHEIRTPLNAISGFSQILAMDSDTLKDEERIDMCQRITDGTRHLTNILDDLILISSYEGRKEPLQTENCLVANIVTHAIELVQPQVRLSVTLESKLMVSSNLIVNTNPLAVQNVLRHLLDNAAKFTNEGTITLTTTADDHELHFTVADTGIGIPEDKREYIFERFTKIDNFSQGAGLGLSVARLLTKQLRGMLTLDTHYSGGAKFDFIIPIA